MNEDTIVYKALEELTLRTEVTGKWKPRKGEIDGELDLQTPTGKLHAYVAVKKELRAYQLAHLIGMAKLHAPFLVIAERIFPEIKQKLRENEIGYIDTAGNVFIKIKNHYIWLDGNRKETKEKAVTNRAFTKTGLRTVFYLLLHPEAIDLPYRQLAEITGVALGNIKNIIEGLNDAGYILRINKKQIRLQQKKELLDRWVIAYGETLRPTLALGKFRFWNRENVDHWNELQIEHGKIIWGGEPAGEHYTNYLRAKTLTAYTDVNRPTMMQKWVLIPEEEKEATELELYKIFWRQEKDELFAPPLLVYADLLLTGDPRCTETAEKIFDNFLKNDIEK
jgi:hypothetical protein